MLRYCIANLFSGIFSVILPNNRKKTAFCIFVIVLLTVDKAKTLPVVFHNSFAIFTAVNHAEDKQFLGITSIKKTLNTHGLWREHDSNMIVVRNLLQYVKGYTGINDHFPIPG